MFTPLDANISANNASHIIPMTTKTVETTLTSTTMSSTKASTAVIFNGITSIMMHSSSTTASGTNNREESKLLVMYNYGCIFRICAYIHTVATVGIVCRAQFLLTIKSHDFIYQ